VDRPPGPKNAEVPILKNGQSWDAGSSEQADNAYVSLIAERRWLLVEGGRRPGLPSTSSSWFWWIGDHPHPSPPH